MNMTLESEGRFWKNYSLLPVSHHSCNLIDPSIMNFREDTGIEHESIQTSPYHHSVQPALDNHKNKRCKLGSANVIIIMNQEVLTFVISC